MASPRSNRLRWSISLGAVLLVPGGLLAAWGVLRFGGGIEEQQLAERQLGDRALEELASAFDLRLESLAPDDPGVFPISLDADGRPGAPFLEPPSGSTSDRISVPATLGTLETAAALLARNDAEGALPFFRNAAGERPHLLPPSAALAMARALHRTGASAEALGLLTDAATEQGDAWLDGLPFPTLAALLEHRIAKEIEDEVRARALERALLSGAFPMPARAAGPILDLLEDADPRDVQDLLRAAAVSVTYMPAGGPRPGPDGSVLLPGTDELGVLAPWRTEELIFEAAQELAPRYPSLTLGPDAQPPWLASARLQPLDRDVYAGPSGPLPSERTAQLAGILAVAALVSFVLGNLLLFGLARKEMALSRMRSNFIDLVSHELRTPLTALSLKAEMLAAGEVPGEKVEEYQRGLHAEAEKLGALVQRILDFARLQKARLPLEPEPVPARSLLAQGIRAGREALRLGDQRLSVSAPRPLPDLWVDREVMTRALRNLIENSSRYAPPGSEVQLRACAEGNRLRVTVADRGPGFGDGNTQNLFEPFRRGVHPAPGSGLGLAIVKQAVEAHGGSVSAANRRDGGAEVVLEIPLARRVS